LGLGMDKQTQTLYGNSVVNADPEASEMQIYDNDRGPDWVFGRLWQQTGCADVLRHLLGERQFASMSSVPSISSCCTIAKRSAGGVPLMVFGSDPPRP
jgi:hypothetical protein